MDETEEIGVRLSLKDRPQFSSDAEKSASGIRDIGQAAEEANTKTSQWSAGLDTASKGISLMASVSQFAKYYVGYQLVGGLASATEGAVSFGLKSSSAFEQAQIAFDTLLGSQSAGEQFTAMLKDFAATTPFNYSNLITTSQRLLAMGFQAKDIKSTLTAIGDAASGLSAGQQGVDRISLALGQMLTRGKIQGQDMLQLTEAGVNGWKILADASGKTVAQVQQDSQNGLIPAQQGVKVLLAGMEQQFGGLMTKQSQTLGGEWSNFIDRVQQKTVTAFEPVKDWLERILPGLTDKAGVWIDKLGVSLQHLMAWFAQVSQTTQFKSTMGDIERIASDLWFLFENYFGPELLQLAMVAIPLLVVGLMLLRDGLDWVRQNAWWLIPALNAVTEPFVVLDSNIQGLISDFEDLWNWITKVGDAIGTGSSGVWNFVTNTLSSDLLGAVPGAATGGTVVAPGLVQVGERGPEILKLNAGAQVIPLEKMPSASGQGSGGDTYIQIHEGAVQVNGADLLHEDRVTGAVISGLQDLLARQ